MSNDYLPNKELELQAWVNNFLTVGTPNAETLGLTAADFALIQTDAGGFTDALDNVVSAKNFYESSVRAKDTSTKKLEKDVRALVKRIQSHAGVPDSLKTQLGISVKNPVINRTPPATPVSLVATPNADGTNLLKWHKAGNKQNTQFVVLAKPLTGGTSASSDAGWTMVGQTTRAVFAHQGVTPGVPMAYRVVAARAGFISNPSFPATVYAS